MQVKKVLFKHALSLQGKHVCKHKHKCLVCIYIITFVSKGFYVQVVSRKYCSVCVRILTLFTQNVLNITFKYPNL